MTNIIIQLRTLDYIFDGAVEIFDRYYAKVLADLRILYGEQLWRFLSIVSIDNQRKRIAGLLVYLNELYGTELCARLILEIGGVCLEEARRGCTLDSRRILSGLSGQNYIQGYQSILRKIGRLYGCTAKWSFRNLVEEMRMVSRRSMSVRSAVKYILESRQLNYDNWQYEACRLRNLRALRVRAQLTHS